MSEHRAVDIDLFAGAGGLAIGLNAAGFSPTDLFEREKHCCDTLRKNTANCGAHVRGGVSELDVVDIDWTMDTRDPVRLLAAGTPCQPFSLGGKHKAQDDDRNLFPEVIRAIRQLRPMAVILENVRGLRRPSFIPYFEYVIRQIQCPSVEPASDEHWEDHDRRIQQHQTSRGYEAEYQVDWRSLNAADFGVPQNRYRVFVVATRSDLPQYNFPEPTHSRTALLRAQRSGSYWKLRGLPIPRRIGVEDLRGCSEERIEVRVCEDGLLPWVTVRDALSGLDEPATSEKEALMNHWRISGARSYPGHSGSTLDWPSKTIKAGVHGVPGGENTVVDGKGNVRYYTLRETARLQTFPDTYYFEGSRIHVTRQIGNAVPCLLAKALASPLYALLAEQTEVCDNA